MKKYITCLLVLVMLALGVFPGTVSAYEPLEPQRDCSLTLYYTVEGVPFADMDIKIYRVAEAFPDGTFDLISPFSSYPVNIYGITSQAEWKTAAATLMSYITANGVSADYTATTDAEGTAVFSTVETGLYLVQGVIGENDKGIYTFEDFMMYLPTPNAEGGFNYILEAKPKCGSVVPKEEYKVVKLWKDAGYPSKRPKNVNVEIRKDGVLQETVVLSADNNWSYSWITTETTAKWTVVETNVPDGYRVSIGTNETGFVITNTYESPEPPPPKTGDTFALWYYVLMLCLSGIGLLVVGVIGMRGKRNGKSK